MIKGSVSLNRVNNGSGINRGELIQKYHHWTFSEYLNRQAQWYYVQI